MIVISSAADAATIKDSLHYGVVDYLIKPFRASRFEEALTGWRQKKMALEKHQYYDPGRAFDQLIHGSSSNEQDPRRLPKGLTPQTLRTLCQWIDAHQDYEFSTDELANEVNISRVSCRKYPHLAGQLPHLVHQYPLWRHGASGLPLPYSGRTLLTAETILPITDRWLSVSNNYYRNAKYPSAQVTSFISKTCARSNIIIPSIIAKKLISLQVNGVFNFKTLTKVN